ncbi:MAG: agmatinase [bacterium]
MATTPNNFLDLPKELSNYKTSQAAILPLPYEATTSYRKGTKTGPAAIIKASQQVEFYDEELNLEPCQVGIVTAKAPAFGKMTPPKAVARIQESCEKLLRDGKFVIGLGGEHTVTVPLVRTMAQKYRDLWVVQLDAHSDMRDSYHGTPYSHASAMARVSEHAKLIGLGIRSGIMGERERLKAPSRIYYAHEMLENPEWQSEVFNILGQHVYLTIDLDFFNPSEVPGVGTPEPGGFGWYAALGFLRRLFATREVVGGDVVELLPQRDSTVSDFFAARLVYKLIGYKFFIDGR